MHKSKFCNTFAAVLKTNKEGIAIFELGRLDLEVIDSQSTFYFATFAEDEKTIIGSTAVTIKSGDKKDVEIYLL